VSFKIKIQFYNVVIVQITMIGKSRLLLKFRVIFIVLTLLNPIITTKLPSHPPKLKKMDSIKNYVCNKK